MRGRGFRGFPRGGFRRPGRPWRPHPRPWRPHRRGVGPWVGPWWGWNPWWMYYGYYQAYNPYTMELMCRLYPWRYPWCRRRYW